VLWIQEFSPSFRALRRKLYLTRQFSTNLSGAINKWRGTLKVDVGSCNIQHRLGRVLDRIQLLAADRLRVILGPVARDPGPIDRDDGRPMAWPKDPPGLADGHSMSAATVGNTPARNGKHGTQRISSRIVKENVARLSVKSMHLG
jgi:hypothetical protein